MRHENEYHDNLITMMELLWGKGYMAPGGPGNVAKMLSGIENSGYNDVTIEDASNWYRAEGRRGLDLMKGELNSRMVELLGQADADYIVENWRAMVVVCDRGEMRQGYCRGRKAD